MSLDGHPDKLDDEELLSGYGIVELQRTRAWRFPNSIVEARLRAVSNKQGKAG